jgi:hypothetical protein
MRNETEMTVTTDAETIVRRAYHAAEGNVMDVQGFIDLFADDGVFNAVGQQNRTPSICGRMPTRKLATLLGITRGWRRVSEALG